MLVFECDVHVLCASLGLQNPSKRLQYLSNHQQNHQTPTTPKKLHRSNSCLKGFDNVPRMLLHSASSDTPCMDVVDLICASMLGCRSRTNFRAVGYNMVLPCIAQCPWTKNSRHGTTMTNTKIRILVKHVWKNQIKPNTQYLKNTWRITKCGKNTQETNSHILHWSKHWIILDHTPAMACAGRRSRAGNRRAAIWHNAGVPLGQMACPIACFDQWPWLRNR